MRKIKAAKRYVRKGVTVLKNEGIVNLGIKSLQKLQKEQIKRSTGPAKKITFDSLVDRDNVIRADWSSSKYVVKKRKHEAPYTINWVMSPPSGGGGHQNMFRFIEHLDKLGHKNNIYLYSTFDDMTIAQAKENVSAYCRAKNLTFRRLKGPMVSADIIFATGWETAYPVFNEKTDAKKMYFVQDFEPYFYAMGTNYILAENTYKFGFHGITAGGFLANKLSREYGMDCESYDFGAEPDLYAHTNFSKRKEVFFYARPVTERRGFDLGIMALELFHKQRPEYVINLAGWDVAGYDIPFPYVNHKALRLEDLSGLYNQCATALVVSLTNMSLLPLELIACGAIPVVNDGPNNRLVSSNQYIKYTDASPSALAKAMIETVDRQDLEAYAKKASSSVQSASWERSKDRFIEIIEKELR